MESVWVVWVVWKAPTDLDRRWLSSWRPGLGTRLPVLLGQGGLSGRGEGKVSFLVRG